MFVNCRHCNALVATDPATDLPPPRCPRCSGVLLDPQATEAATPDAAAATPASTAASTPDIDATADDDAPATQAAGDDAATPPAPNAPAPEPSPDAGDEAPATAEAAPPAAAPAPLAPDRGEDTPPPLPDASDTDIASTSADAAPAADTSATASPGFLSTTAAAATRTGGRRRWGAPAAIVALVLLLGLQVVLADRARLAADAGWRPLAAAVCGVFSCSLPPWREPSAFVLLAREVRPHPDVAGALRVRASFRNDARWAQAWPHLVLTLSDIDGRAVAARAFDADDYLAVPATDSLLEPGQTADIALDIREPGVATVSYTFDFR